MRIQNGTVLTMEGERFETGYVEFENGIITACGDLRNAPVYCGETFDAAGGFILPGLIDAHTHIGISEEGLRWEGEDCNETTSVRHGDPEGTARGRDDRRSCPGQHERDRRANRRG